MNKNTIKTALICGAALYSLSAEAQSLNTGYFSEGYVYRHQLNPAFAGSRNYVSIPTLSSFNVDMGMNIGVKNFIYEQPNGKLTTFMNSSVDANKFLNDLPDKPQFNINSDIMLLSGGFRAFGGYNTIEVGTHIRSNVTISKDLFVFMKDMRNTTYNFSDLQATAMGWMDIAFGHSRNINEELRVGAKTKLLIGLAYANVDLSGSSATLGTDEWLMNVNGDMNIAGGGSFSKKIGSNEMSGYKDFAPGVNGLGLAFDLGATYDMQQQVPGLSLSASVTDLGFMSWDCAVAGADNKQFRFDGFEQLEMHPRNDKYAENAGNLEDQWGDTQDDLEAAFKLDVKDDARKMTGIGATLHLGAEYKLPSYDKVKFGALYTQRISKSFSYLEARLVANYSPAKVIDFSLTGCSSSYGASIGGLVNLNCQGFSFFFGVDRTYMGSINKDMIPLEKASLSFATGMNITFGDWE